MELARSSTDWPLVSSTRDAFALNNAVGRRRVTKYDNYFHIYDKYMHTYVGKPITLVEIGVQHGGSLDMWRAYLGPQARIIGIDINPDCRRFAQGRTEIQIGDQSDPAFLSKLSAEIGQVDVIIDDGSHIPSHQKSTFEILFFKNLKEGGAYLVEDCHSSYFPQYGGGYRNRHSFIEYAKTIADQVNTWHAADSRVKHTAASDWVENVAFFSSVVAFEKRPMSTPARVTAGDQMLDLDAPFRKSGAVVTRLKQVAFVQRLVRQNPVLWRLMRRMISE